MLTNDGVIKVMDFGIAHVEHPTSTQDGALLGTPSYKSRKQIRGDKVDGLSDIFSLGIIVHEMAAGNRPLLGESLATIFSHILSQMPYRRSRFWLLISTAQCHRRLMPCSCRPYAAENP